MKPFRAVFYLIFIVWSALTLLSWMASRISPTVLPWLSGVGLLYPLWWAGQVSFAVVLWIGRSRYRWIALAMAAFASLALPKYYGFGALFDTPTANHNHSIRLLTHNIYGFKPIKKAFQRDSSSGKRLLHQATDLYRDHDILCLQEVNPYSAQLLKAALPQYHFVQAGTAGPVIMSRDTILQFDTIGYENPVNACLWADIRIDSTTVRVICVHLYSNRVSIAADSLQQSTRPETALHHFKRIFQRYTSSAARRADEVDQILQLIDTTPHPIVLLGDLNDHPLSYIYRQLRQRLYDPFPKYGNGPGTTYKNYLPLLRIDYILIDTTFSPIHYRIVPTRSSDHHMVSLQVSTAQ